MSDIQLVIKSNISVKNALKGVPQLNIYLNIIKYGLAMLLEAYF